MVKSRFFRLILLSAVLWGLSPTWIWAGPPTEQLRATVDEVIRILADQSLKQQPQRRRELLRQVINKRFSYEDMARYSLGQYWRNLSPAQRAEFIDLFSQLLERSYANKIEGYTDEKVIYQAERPDGDGYEVRTLIQRRNDQIPVTYRLLNKSGKWWVYDVVIEGVSLVSNYRSQFNRIIRESGYQELVQRMRRKLQEEKEMDKL